MISDIEKLDAAGREKGRVIYSIHQCNAGWGVQWYDYNRGTPSMDGQWRYAISVYGYYPTIAEMIKAETDRVASWEVMS